MLWVSTVRPDGRPHVTPLISVGLDGAAYFCTGPGERKARNLVQCARCVLTTGCNLLREGFDVVIEGDAECVSEDAKLERVAALYESKDGTDRHFDVRDGAFYGRGGEAIVFKVAPSTVFGFGRDEYSQTGWRFESD